MKHLFKTEGLDDGILLSLAIKITHEEAFRISQNSNDSRCKYPISLTEGYDEDGLEWLLHLLRLYISFGEFPSEFKPEEKRKKKKKKRKKKKARTNT